MFDYAVSFCNANISYKPEHYTIHIHSLLVYDICLDSDAGLQLFSYIQKLTDAGELSYS